MKKTHIGYVVEDSDEIAAKAFIDEDKRMNAHTALIGKSGCGKTTAMMHLAISKAEAGDATIIFDYNNVLADDQIPEEMRERFEKVKNEINVYRDGFHCDIMTPIVYRNGITETIEDVVDNFADTLGRSMVFKGPRQMARLKEAARIAVKMYNEKGILAVGEVLEDIGDLQCIALLDKLGVFFRYNVFRPGDFSIKEGCMNIIRLSMFSPSIQYAIAELILCYLYRRAIAHVLPFEKISIFIDEAHNISGAQGIVSSLLTEGRKYGISVAIATQSLSQVRSSRVLISLFQASNIFFFQPAKNEVQEVAKYIDEARTAKWIVRLKHLKVGEFIAIGPLIIDDQPVDRPIIVRAVLGEMRSSYEYSDKKNFSARNQVPSDNHQELQIQRGMRVCPIEINIPSEKNN